jgi:hypothetical protein
MWDSPGDGAPVQHEGFPGTVANPIPIIRYRFNLDFRSDLVFWTDITAPVPVVGTLIVTGNPADRLYATIVTNLWFIRISFSFNQTTGAGTRTNLQIFMKKDVDPANPAAAAKPARLAAPAEGNSLQVRGPISLQLLATDART